MEMEIGKPFHIILGVKIYASARERRGGEGGMKEVQVNNLDSKNEK